MHENAVRVKNFYESLNQGNGEEMAAAYHPEATFSDPVFDLKGSDIGDMWRMFCIPGSELKVESSSVVADDKTGSAHWEATYTFRPTGRQVHNVVEARFDFKDGLITAHHDDFNLTTWARQALGISGTLFGWTPRAHRKIRSQAADQLEKFKKRYKGRIS